jgi:hypothetical protein
MATKDGKEASDKEIYELWWEYLKRSKKFKEFCEQMNELGEDHFGDYYSVFAEYMRSFGNIFNKSVEDWLNEPRRQKGKLPGSLPVLDLRDKGTCRSVHFNALTNWDSNSEAFPSQKKIWEIIKHDTQYIFLAVPVVGREDMASIDKQIKKIRDSYKKTAAVKEADKELRKGMMASTRLRYDEIAFYLKVYDLREQGLTTKQVIEKLAPSKYCGDVIVHREFNRFNKNAKVIIANVERGFFPGQYGPDHDK